MLSSGASENCGGATYYRVLEGLTSVAPQKLPPAASQGDHGICCRPRWGVCEAGDAREKRYSVHETGPHMATLSCLWPYEWTDAVYAPSGRRLVVGKAMTPAGQTSWLTSLEPDISGVKTAKPRRSWNRIRRARTAACWQWRDVLKVEVTATSKSLVDYAADITVPSERSRGEERGPPIKMCEHFDAFSGWPQSSDHWNAASRFWCNSLNWEWTDINWTSSANSGTIPDKT